MSKKKRHIGLLTAGAAIAVATATALTAPAVQAAAPGSTTPDAVTAGAVQPAAVPPSWPTATGQQTVTATITVSGTFDGGMKRFIGGGDLGDGGQSENQDPLFDLPSGGTLQNVILGAPAADGVHCEATCTLRNVWWEDVGEDAATLKGTSTTQTMTINGGGAKAASDKVFQHNGPGTMIIENFQVQNFGKLYRSCGNCKTQFTRHVVVQNVFVTAPGSAIVGINSNFGDTAQLTGITMINDPSKKISICDRYTGNNTGAEPVKIGSGPDGTFCKYSTSDIVYN